MSTYLLWISTHNCTDIMTYQVQSRKSSRCKCSQFISLTEWMTYSCSNVCHGQTIRPWIHPKKRLYWLYFCISHDLLISCSITWVKTTTPVISKSYIDYKLSWIDATTIWMLLSCANSRDYKDRVISWSGCSSWTPTSQLCEHCRTGDQNPNLSLLWNGLSINGNFPFFSVFTFLI